jgi:hypothetical protein
MRNLAWDYAAPKTIHPEVTRRDDASFTEWHH